MERLIARSSNLSSPSSQAGSFTSNQTVHNLIQNVEMEKILEGRSIRVALGVVSALLAIYVVYRIWLDNWRTTVLSYRQRSKKYSFLYHLHPAELFPLVLGFAIFIQEVVFVTIQAITINQMPTSNCKEPGIFALLSMLLLGTLHLVFGLELTISALRKNPFSTRHRFAFIINIFITGLLLLITLVVAQTSGFHSKKCSGGLIFLMVSLRMNRAILVILSLLTFLFIVMACILATKLKRTVHIDPAARISGSRMVYYLVLSVIVQIFVIPIFALEAVHPSVPPVTASTVAEYALFISGALIAFLHLFLRANAARMAIKPSETPWHKKRCFRLFGPNELEVMNISPPLNLVHPNYRAEEKSTEAYRRSYDKLRYKSLPQTPATILTYPPKSADTILRDKSWPLAKEVNTSPNKIHRAQSITSPTSNKRSSARSHKRRPSYTLFPGADEIQLPATVYTPPAATHIWTGPRRVSDIEEASPESAPRPTPTSPQALTTSAILPMPNSIAQSFLSANPPIHAPPEVPWLARRPTVSQSSATVPIGIRLSTMPSAPGALLGGLHTVTDREQLRSIAPFDDSFTSAFQAQVHGATGRDLNSFRWIDSPVDDNDVDRIEVVRDDRGPLAKTATTTTNAPIATMAATTTLAAAMQKRLPLRSVSPSIYPEEEETHSPHGTGWI